MNDFFMFLPSLKKYKIQLVSSSKLRKNMLLHMKASVKSIFRQNIVKYLEKLLSKPNLTLKSYKYAKNSKTYSLLLFTSFESNSELLLCKLVAAIVVNPVHHSGSRPFQVRGTLLRFVLIHFL